MSDKTQPLRAALVGRRQILLAKLSRDSVRNNPEQIKRIAHELREISKRTETYAD